MLVMRHRLVIAGVITATALAVPAVALASGSGSSPGKPGATPTCAASACKPTAGAPGKSAAGVPGKPAVPSQLAALAASAGISPDKLQAGLGAAKRAGGNTPAGIAAFAASAGVPQATAQRIVQAVFGTAAGNDTTGQAAFAAALASRLGVSTSAAQRAVNQLQALGQGGVDPASPAFAAIARDLGASPAQLAAALHAAKQSLAGQ